LAAFPDCIRTRSSTILPGGGIRMLRIKYLLSTKPKSIWSIGPNEPVLQAIRLMSEKEVGALPVIEADKLIGIVSERDYARKVILLGRSSADTAVSQIMTSELITISPEDTVHRCMELMTEKRIRHLPVLEKHKLVGMISIGDLVKAVIEEQQQTIVQLERYIAG
jgi:predicted transcriptional regulator